METTLRDLAEAVVEAQTAADDAAKRAHAARAALLAAMNAHAAVKLELDGAAINRSVKHTAEIDDPVAFIAWVEARYPTEIHTIRKVRDTFQTKLLRGCAENRINCDPEGEVIPGIEVIRSEPYLSVRITGK